MSPSSEEHGKSRALRILFERHRALTSAWQLLSASSLSGEKYDVGEAGRELGEDLLDLAGADAGGSDSASEMDSRLQELEGAMRASALGIPIHQLRSILPRGGEHDRQGLLALLDLLLGAEVEELAGVEARIPALDYLITLLCIGDPGRDAAVSHDPATLTPRLAALCERCDQDVDPDLSAVEAEFFAAADLYEADAGQKVAKRSLRRRKAALGRAYFAPRILRAIVTYNAARLRGSDEEFAESRDREAPPRAQERVVEGGAEAVHGAGSNGPGSEADATDGIGAVEDALPLQANAAPADLGDVPARVSGEPQVAFAVASEASRKRPHAAAAEEPSSPADDLGRVARELAREALSSGRDDRRRGAGKRWQALPVGRLVRWGAGVCLVGLIAFVFSGWFSNSDLAGYSRADLDVLSPYLSSGARNLDGRGPAFVGALYDDFFAGSAADQTRLAADLVAALRATGVSQIMIYDSEQRLRVQALGRQTVRLLSTEGG